MPTVVLSVLCYGTSLIAYNSCTAVGSPAPCPSKLTRNLVRWWLRLNEKLLENVRYGCVQLYKLTKICCIYWNTEKKAWRWASITFSRGDMFVITFWAKLFSMIIWLHVFSRNRSSIFWIKMEWYDHGNYFLRKYRRLYMLKGSSTNNISYKEIT